MSNQPDSLNPDELCVLNDVRFFDISTKHWLPATQPSSSVSDTHAPRARYAHLSSVTADRLFIIGGQDFNNTWLDDVCVYDLANRAWVQRRDYPRHCGTYRSVAVSANTSVRLPQEEIRNSQSASTLGPPGQRFGPDKGSPPSPEPTLTETLIHLPYSAPPSEDFPSDIFLYSNYNVRFASSEPHCRLSANTTSVPVHRCQARARGIFAPCGQRLRHPGQVLGNGWHNFPTWTSFSHRGDSRDALDYCRHIPRTQLPILLYMGS